MRSNDFIETPINPQKPTNFMEDMFDEDQAWQRRARKLRDRRWRKLATRLAVSDRGPYHPRHLSY